MALRALARLLAHQRATRSTEAAIQTALRLLALDALQEAAHRTLMQLYVETGRRAAALRQYQLCQTTLRRELKAEPEKETTRLYEEILRGRVLPALSQPVLGSAWSDRKSTRLNSSHLGTS